MAHSPSPPAARTRAKRPRTPTPPSSSVSESDSESSSGDESLHAAAQSDDDLSSLPDLTAGGASSTRSNAASSSILITPRSSQAGPSTQIPLNQPRNSTSSAPSISIPNKKRHAPLKRRRQPKLHERSQEEQVEMWHYFLASAYSQLDEPIPAASPGTVDEISSDIEAEVYRMWLEGRTKYNRRNLDHMAIMLSTWRTSREYNLCAKALRAFYTKNQRSIMREKGAYVSAHLRPANWPFHSTSPQDIEATAWWIWDWGTKEANRFLGREQDEGSPSAVDSRDHFGQLDEVDQLDGDVKIEGEVEDDLVSYASD